MGEKKKKTKGGTKQRKRRGKEKKKRERRCRGEEQDGGDSGFGRDGEIFGQSSQGSGSGNRRRKDTRSNCEQVLCCLRSLGCSGGCFNSEDSRSVCLPMICFLLRWQIECGVGIFTKTATERERRRENFSKELDFGFADVVCF